MRMNMARLLLPLISAALLALAASVGAEPLRGRLFFSADERAKLDQMRQKSGGAISPTATDHVTLSGIVKRSGGKATVWINQAPQHEDDIPSGIAVHAAPDSAEGVALRLPSGKTVKLKAGQTLDTAKGNIREGYESAGDSARPEAQAAKK